MFKEVLSIVFLFLTLIFVFSCAREHEGDTGWEKESIKATREFPYSCVYKIPGCFIYARADSAGIMVEAWSADSLARMHCQTTKIHANGDSISTERITVRYDLLGEKNRWILPKYYDVFYVHYRERAFLLPKEVKKIFFKYWGVE